MGRDVTIKYRGKDKYGGSWPMDMWGHHRRFWLDAEAKLSCQVHQCRFKLRRGMTVCEKLFVNIGHIKTFYKFMNESVSKDVGTDIMKVAKGIDYETFLRKTDSLHQNILYKGMVQGDVLQDMCFMTDYIGHAKRIEMVMLTGLCAMMMKILRFNDKTFNTSEA